MVGQKGKNEWGGGYTMEYYAILVFYVFCGRLQ